jgi:hypothetical protein
LFAVLQFVGAGPLLLVPVMSLHELELPPAGAAAGAAAV